MLRRVKAVLIPKCGSPVLPLYYGTRGVTPDWSQSAAGRGGEMRRGATSGHRGTGVELPYSL